MTDRDYRAIDISKDPSEMYRGEWAKKLQDDVYWNRLAAQLRVDQKLGAAFKTQEAQFNKGGVIAPQDRVTIVKRLSEYVFAAAQSTQADTGTFSSSTERVVQTGKLTEADIKRIANDALLRKAAIDDIDERRAFQDYRGYPGILSDLARQADVDVPKKIKDYESKFSEEYPAGIELLLALSKMPDEIGRRFQAHGIDKGGDFRSLINLLENGVDPNRPFHTISLTKGSDNSAMGAAGPYTEGGIIVVGPVRDKKGTERQLIYDRNSKRTQIHYVILDKFYYFAIPELSKAFPNVKFVRAEDLTEFMKEEVKRKDATVTSKEADVVVSEYLHIDTFQKFYIKKLPVEKIREALADEKVMTALIHDGKFSGESEFKKTINLVNLENELTQLVESVSSVSEQKILLFLNNLLNSYPEVQRRQNVLTFLAQYTYQINFSGPNYREMDAFLGEVVTKFLVEQGFVTKENGILPSLEQIQAKVTAMVLNGESQVAIRKYLISVDQIRLDIPTQDELNVIHEFIPKPGKQLWIHRFGGNRPGNDKHLTAQAIMSGMLQSGFSSGHTQMERNFHQVMPNMFDALSRVRGRYYNDTHIAVVEFPESINPTQTFVRKNQIGTGIEMPIGLEIPTQYIKGFFIRESNTFIKNPAFQG